MTTHRHKDSVKKWTTSVTDPDLSVYAKKADLDSAIAAVEAQMSLIGQRIEKLEADLANVVLTISQIVGPPVTPPTPPDPPPPVTPPVPPVTPPPVTPPGNVYGSGIGSDSLANTQVGGTYNLKVAYRFRSTASSALNSVRIYIVDGVGYAGGNGGSIEVSIQADDGSASHLPTGTNLAATTITPGNPVSIGYLPLVTFASPPTLVAGTLYHVVFRNTSASPTVNFMSVNSMLTFDDQQQARVDNMDWTQLMQHEGAWQVRPGFVPILALNYANGAAAGQGYMEVWLYGYERITGSTYMVRESFTVSVMNRAVSSVAVRLKRTSGSSPLAVRLETSSGTLVAETSIPAASIAQVAPTDWDSGGSTWGVASFSSPAVLTAGQRYNLRFSTAADTEYSIYAIRQGKDYSFPTATYFADGLAYHTTDGGSTWNTFGNGGGTHYGQCNLQFYLGTT